MILIVIIRKECVVFEVPKLTALLVLVVNHRGRTADVAPALLHLLLESPLVLHLLDVVAVVEVVVAVVASIVLVVLLLVVLSVVDLLYILVLFVRVLVVVVQTATWHHVLVVVVSLLRVQQLHVLLEVGLALRHAVVRVRDWRALLDHLVLGGLLLRRGSLFGGGGDVDGEAIEVESGHLVGPRLDVYLEEIEPGVARLTIKCNIALTFHVLVFLGRVVIPQVAARGVAHSALSRVV